MKVVIGTKQGKCLQKELKEGAEAPLVGLKLGDKVSGDAIGLAGYEFQITGGSDHCGFPMRSDIEGVQRRKVLAVEGIGQKKKARGIRYRKTIAGNTIHSRTAQVNMKVVKEGKEPLFAPEEPAQAQEGTAESEQPAQEQKA